MKKALLRFFVEDKEKKSLYVMITCNEENDGEDAPVIAISPDDNGTALLSVLDFEIDHEKSGKLWINDLELSLDDKIYDDGVGGVLWVKNKSKIRGELMHVSIIKKFEE